MNDPIPAHSVAEPGLKRSSRWLNVAKLRTDIKERHIDAIRLKRLVKDDHRSGQAELGGFGQCRLGALRIEITQLCALRALHRGKRHTRRRRAFGPQYAATNGTAIVEGPPVIPQWLLDKYAPNHPPKEPLPGADEVA